MGVIGWVAEPLARLPQYNPPMFRSLRLHGFLRRPLRSCLGDLAKNFEKKIMLI